jgi:hypothetical protein
MMKTPTAIIVFTNMNTLQLILGPYRIPLLRKLKLPHSVMVSNA